MKRFIIFITILISSFSVFAQEQKDVATAAFKVDGTCNMCKKRIENAAYSKGVKRAEWNKSTKMLTVVYRPSKTTEAAIQKKIAHAGHDAGTTKATEEEYKSLPDCCAYKTAVCND